MKNFVWLNNKYNFIKYHPFIRNNVKFVTELHTLKIVNYYNNNIINIL